MADPNNIQASVPYRTAVAERGKFFPVDQDYLTSIGYPASGEGKYAILTYPVSQPLLSRLGPITNLNAVTSTGAGATVDVSNYHNFTIHIVSSAITDGGTINIEHSIDGVNWATVSTNIIDSDGVNEVAISNQAYRYLRTSLVLRTDGTFSTYIYAGN